MKQLRITQYIFCLLFLSNFTFAGNEANVTRTVTVVVPVLTSLSLSSSTTTLNVGETTELTVMGTYSDNTSKTVIQGIAYVNTPSNSVEVNGTVLTAKKDGNVTVQATAGGVNSNSLNLTITWVVDGHVLPPEPDPAVNNATLLGIDVNDNGVRDDVERWIYETYDHPIERGIFMQSARAYNMVIVDPSKAHETVITPPTNNLNYAIITHENRCQKINPKRTIREKKDSNKT